MKNKLTEKAKDPKYIPGIYNYCDRWCERCAFTSKCLNYSQLDDKNLLHKDFDTDNEEFWDELSDIYKETIQLIYDVAEEQGIDLNAVDEEDVELEMQKRKSLKEAATKKNYIKLAKKYIVIGRNWLEKSENDFLNKKEELIKQLELQLPEKDPIKEAKQINNFIEIISWYLHFIYVKFMRASTSKMNYIEDKEEEFWAKDDSDATAKTALIAVERSISAWAVLLKLFKNNENEILDILVILKKIEKSAKNEFPDAMKFIRPGLDE